MLAVLGVRNTVLSSFQAIKRCAFSTVSPLVDVSFIEDQGFAVVSMQNKPVNSLGLDMNKTLTSTIKELEDRGCKGMILTSSLPKVYCAGLNINQLYQTPVEKFNNYWNSFQDLWYTLYGSKMATVALVNGHAIAGGCVLAISCDYRVMVDGPYKMGLNETKIGMVVPYWLKDVYINTIGVRASELALQLGTIFNVQEAHQIGLIDVVAPDVRSAEKLAQTQLLKFLEIPSTARHLTKLRVREATLKGLSDDREGDTKRFVGLAMQPHVQEVLGNYLKSLSKK